MKLELYWQGVSEMDMLYQVFVHIVDGQISDLKPYEPYEPREEAVPAAHAPMAAMSPA